MASTGRPSKLHAVIGRTDDGTDITCAQLVLDETAAGQPLEVVAALANINRSTLLRWLKAGAAVEERLLINPDAPVDDNDLDYRDFRIAYDRARAQGEQRCWQLMHTLAEGGVTRRVVERRDGQGNVIERVLTTETRVPSFQALAWMMRNGYDRHETVEVKVEQGALSDDERAGELATAIETWLAADTARQQLEAGPELNGNGNGQH